ncbi:MAG: hypothetical protein ACI8PQ_001063 [Planctomycetota bacterium]|jgi:hypothetical protein
MISNTTEAKLHNPFVRAGRQLHFSRSLRTLGLLLLAGLATTGIARADAGLQGDYYNAKTPPTLGIGGDFVRVDGTLNFNWNGDAPDGTTIVADDSYSTRWTGFVHVATAGSWTFKTLSNDGVRLWVNGTQVINNWTSHAATLDTATVSLPNSGWVPIRVEHFNDGGTAVMQLRFEGPQQPDVVIPSSCLSSTYPGGNPPLAVAGDVQVNSFGSNFTLSGSVSGGLGGTTPLWSQIAGPTAVIQTPNSATTLVTPSATGLHTFQLLASDAVGGTAFDFVDIYVTAAGTGGSVTGQLRKWFPLTVDFNHSATLSETSGVNPFLDLRLEVHFVHLATATVHRVPGFFAADGDAANSGAQGGQVWRARFAPEFSGTWHYIAFFRSGTDVAISAVHLAGTAASFDGDSGTVFVQAVDPNAIGFRNQGRLEYVGTHHRHFSQTGEAFLKTGTDSPENLLAYYEFDGTQDFGGAPNALDGAPYSDGLHHFDAHLADYTSLGGGPTWSGGKGKRLIGALNYLADSGVNSIYFLTYNTDGGDGQEVFPWTAPQNKLRFDVSKLAQWALVFEHAQELGLHLHIVLQEVENEGVLDAGSLGRERKLYYRELVARFGHELALTWNIGEEFGGTSSEVMDFADELRALDTWDHPIKVHTHPDAIDDVYDPLLGDTSFEGASLQMDASEAVERTQQLRLDSAAAGQPWVVEYDEQNPAGIGLEPDSVDPDHLVLRRDALWGNLLAGGGGVEWYFGYGFADDDLDCEDFRSRANMWRQSDWARSILEDHFPFATMAPDDSLASASNAHVLALEGESYAVLRPLGGTTMLDLGSSTATFTVDWLSARKAGLPLNGNIVTVTGPGLQDIGAPPVAGIDWIGLVRRADNRGPKIQATASEPSPFDGNADITISTVVSDPDGQADIAKVSIFIFDPALTFMGEVPLTRVAGETYATSFSNVSPLAPGTWWMVSLAVDSEGLIALGFGNMLAR